MKSRPLILISNDDGIHAEGIQVLAKALQKIARVVVVAPDREQSASSHSLTLRRPLRVVRHSPWQFSVDGTPTDCVILAVHEVLKRRPDLVVSGINAGPNLGEDVHYSGTVSAAVEGALIGIPSVAVSLVAFEGRRFHFNTAALFAKKVCHRLLKFPQSKRPEGFVLNVNIPNCPMDKVRGIEFTQLGKRDYGDVIFKKIDPRGKKYYWIGGSGYSFEDIPGSDGNAIEKKKISVTPLMVDMTDRSLLAEIMKWKF